MGQKVNPTGFRMGKFLPWKSRWFAQGDLLRKNLISDIKIRDALMKKLKMAGVTEVEIERLRGSMVIYITVSRPGVVIGRGGSGLEELKEFVLNLLGGKEGLPEGFKIDFKINEERNPELSARLVAARIAQDLERRVPHRRVVTKAMDRVMQSGALGVKVILSGRIAGAEIARVEKYHRGSVPTQTLRKNIDYAQEPALLKRGYVGVKVYIHRKKEEE